MDRLDAIKTPKVDSVLLKQVHLSKGYVTGTLCLTDRHLIFIEPTGAQETWVLYHHIQSTERQPLTTKGYPLVLECKTFQQLHLIIPRESDCLAIMDTIKQFSQPAHYRDLYAFVYQPKEGEIVKRSSGWVLYDSGSEYSRMGVPNDYWKSTNLNEKYEMCETYSNILYVPACAENSVIQGSAKFRSKGRLPALSFYYQPNKTAICRSSQPLVGLRGRSAEDEQLIQCIVDANPNSDVMYMIDTRPKINAMANKAAGKGYESTDHYSNVIYEFFNIHNIHVMRESLQKLVDAASVPMQSTSGFLLGVESSGWLKHIHLVLDASIFCAKAMVEEGRSVLVHCSDGWDRTAQTCALTSLLIDSYYRTLHGFMILIEKEWLSFGHKFSIRSGHLAGDVRETSPIFTQFLDCVWQLMVQFPSAFQFNEHFLVTIHHHVFSCQFGTFLGNCERERLLNVFSDQTYSLWGNMWAHLDDFMNPLYSPAKSHDKLLLPNTDVPLLKFWIGLYCHYPIQQHVGERKHDVMGSLLQQNDCLTEHIKFIQENIANLQEQLQVFEKHDKMSKSRRGDHINDNSCDFEDVLYSSTTSDDHVGIAEEEDGPLRSQDTASVSKEDGKNSPSSADDVAKSTGNKEKSSGYKSVDNATTDLGGASKASCQNNVDSRTNSSSASNSSSSSSVAVPQKRPALTIDIPTSTLRDDVRGSDVAGGREGDEEFRLSPSEVLSPRSCSAFKTNLLHVPGMNLPWLPMRTATKCGCGVTFSYSTKKYHCSHCGSVVCGSCGSNQAPLPWQPVPKPRRVCKSCYKMIKKIRQEADSSAVN